MDEFTQHILQQQQIAALMNEYMKQASGPAEKDSTVQNELANKPRYDITGERYGNTISDDMISIKNPRVDRHAPESYKYFAQPKGNAGVMTQEAPEPQPLSNVSVNPHIFPWNRLERPIGRKKTIGEGEGVVTGDSAWEYLDPPGEVLSYFEALRNIAQANQLSTDSAREEKFGKVPTKQDPRYDANYDYYLETPVNYNLLSGAQLAELAKMGVDRPIETEYDASADLMGLVNLYRRNLGLK